MKIFLTIVLLFAQFIVHSQNELKNTFSAWYEILGGMEDSGISRTESFMFVASKTIKIKQIYYNNKEIILNANDSIQVSRHSYKPYSGAINNTQKVTNEKKDVPLEKRFRVFKKNNCYYISALSPYEWDGTLQYVYKKKTYTSITKKNFDKGSQDAAP